MLLPPQTPFAVVHFIGGSARTRALRMRHLRTVVEERRRTGSGSVARRGAGPRKIAAASVATFNDVFSRSLNGSSGRRLRFAHSTWPLFGAKLHVLNVPAYLFDFSVRCWAGRDGVLAFNNFALQDSIASRGVSRGLGGGRRRNGLGGFRKSVTLQPAVVASGIEFDPGPATRTLLAQLAADAAVTAFRFSDDDSTARRPARARNAIRSAEKESVGRCSGVCGAAGRAPHQYFR